MQYNQFKGKEKVKVVPLFISLFIQIFPLCFSTIPFTKIRPKPDPISPLVPT